MTAARLGATIRTALPYLALAVVAVGMLNFLWFVSETAPLNLIPSDGRVSDGHYFLWSKTNGGYVEVSRSFWEWVRFHEPTVFLSWPLVMLAMGYLVLAHLSGVAAGRTSLVGSSQRVRQVRDSGPLLASTRSAGLIGKAWFSRPLLRIETYPAGIVVKPLLMAEGAILASEIGAVTPEGGLSAQSVPDRGPVLGFRVSEVAAGYRPKGPLVRVDHAGVGMASPLVILGSGSWGIARAINSIAERARATSATAVMAPPQEPATSAPRVETTAAAQDGIARGSLQQPLPAPVRMGLEVLGMIVGAALLWAGITWAIPQLGLFGVAWTGVVIVILAVNARRMWRGWHQ